MFGAQTVLMNNKQTGEETFHLSMLFLIITTLQLSVFGVMSPNISLRSSRKLWSYTQSFIGFDIGTSVYDKQFQFLL